MGDLVGSAVRTSSKIDQIIPGRGEGKEVGLWIYDCESKDTGHLN